MQRFIFVVAFRRDGICSKVEYIEVAAHNAQKAVDWVRYEMDVFEVVGCYKQVLNWF